MNTNEQLMSRFYTAFQRLDYKTMQDCYHKDAIFSDPVFGLLDAPQVKAMWEMLCKRAKDFTLEFLEVKSEDEYGTCKWIAKYTFSQTGRRVVNDVKAFMKFADGKIIEHSDGFSIWKWNRQALGWKGWLLGWTNFMQNRIHRNARKNLDEYMNRNK
jgi:ketosteroid isomerase-like protein